MTERGAPEKVAIIGAGIGGCYLVAQLGLAGFNVRLHDIDASKLLEIREHGGMDVEGEKGGFAPVELVTSDLAAAVKGGWYHYRGDRWQCAGGRSTIACTAVAGRSGDPVNPG